MKSSVKKLGIILFCFLAILIMYGIFGKNFSLAAATQHKYFSATKEYGESWTFTPPFKDITDKGYRFYSVEVPSTR